MSLLRTLYSSSLIEEPNSKRKKEILLEYGMQPPTAPHMMPPSSIPRPMAPPKPPTPKPAYPQQMYYQPPHMGMMGGYPPPYMGGYPPYGYPPKPQDDNGGILKYLLAAGALGLGGAGAYAYSKHKFADTKQEEPSKASKARSLLARGGNFLFNYGSDIVGQLNDITQKPMSATGQAFCKEHPEDCERDKQQRINNVMDNALTFANFAPGRYRGKVQNFFGWLGTKLGGLTPEQAAESIKSSNRNRMESSKSSKGGKKQTSNKSSESTPTEPADTKE